jgi:hypothetical protein
MYGIPGGISGEAIGAVRYRGRVMAKTSLESRET